jgi:hypothetical protein
MKLGGGKLESSERISAGAFAALAAVLAVLGLWLLHRGVRDWGAIARVLLRLSPGLAAAACVVALYFEDRVATLTHLASTVVFLQVLMICMLFLDVTLVDALRSLYTALRASFYI